MVHSLPGYVISRGVMPLCYAAVLVYDGKSLIWKSAYTILPLYFPDADILWSKRGIFTYVRLTHRYYSQGLSATEGKLAYTDAL